MIDFLLQILPAAAAMVLAITLHEAAHGYAALALGDSTARNAGRLSLNPLRHVDRVGTVILPGILLITQLILPPHAVRFMFGWAKPVPVDPRFFRDPRRGMMLVAMAGPAMNFLLAFLAVLALPDLPLRRPVSELQYLDLVERVYPLLGGFLVSFIVFNLVLGLFNLLPVPPLDGGRIVVGLLPYRAAMAWAELEGAGILVVVFLVFLLPMIASQLGLAFNPVMDALETVLPWAVRLLFDAAGHDGGAQCPRHSDAPAAPDAAAAETLLLRLEGFEGPLDLLLDLARGQKVDLARISILALVEQYLAVVEGARKIRLELAADWLVMAAWLAWLKSRLLLPRGSEAAEEGEAAADALAARLAELSAMRTAAAWLGARVQLGQDVFRRGAPEEFRDIDRSRLVVDLGQMVQAYLAAIRRGTRARRYQPRPVTLWSVKQALARLGAMLGSLPDWASLERFLPDSLTSPLERRGAVAATLLAGLEMARDGALSLRQEQPFGPILVRRREMDMPGLEGT